MNRTTGKKINNEQEHIRQSVADILLTPIGSRIERREYGSQIPMLLARPISSALFLQLASASVMALTRWEKRISVTQFVVRFNQDTNQLIANIRYVRKQDNQINNINDVILGVKQ